jgi:hypothetical protein
MRFEVRLALLVLVGACSQRQRMPEVRPFSSSGSEAEINEVIEGALQADSRLQPADSLYAPHGLVVAEGKVRRTSPRYAGLGGAGDVAITNTQMEIRSNAAWGDVEYRWVSGQSNAAQIGRALFVQTPARGQPGWWIVQAHSSIAR